MGTRFKCKYCGKEFTKKPDICDVDGRSSFTKMVDKKLLTLQYGDKNSTYTIYKDCSFGKNQLRKSVRDELINDFIEQEVLFKIEDDGIYIKKLNKNRTIMVNDIEIKDSHLLPNECTIKIAGVEIKAKIESRYIEEKE